MFERQVHSSQEQNTQKTRADEKVDEICARLVWVEKQTGVSTSSARITTKLLQLQSYKTTLIRKHYDTDREAILDFELVPPRAAYTFLLIRCGKNYEDSCSGIRRIRFLRNYILVL
jgi:hypothetical protein